MQEISPHVYIDTSYAGVTLGAISGKHGLIMIDSPLRADDIRAWRAALLNLGGSAADRLLINLDAHYDRTLGVRGMECTVVAHESTAEIFRNRPLLFKAQGFETGSEWEMYNGLGTIRWAAPDLSFTDVMHIHWDDQPVMLEYHPGPASGSIWAVLPEAHVAFIGDTVMDGQPPFLAGADIPQWLETLNLLLSPEWAGYLLVSGRGGLVGPEEVREQIRQLEKIKAVLDRLAEIKSRPEDTHALVPELMNGHNYSDVLEAHYMQRLRWGLQQYFARNYRRMNVEVDA
ncbi:MAG TPA: hypothetical protein VIO36_02970 [Anaerolineaceae bacterium]